METMHGQRLSVHDLLAAADDHHQAAQDEGGTVTATSDDAPAIRLRNMASNVELALERATLRAAGMEGLAEELRELADELERVVTWLPAQTAARLVDLLSRVEPWPLPATYRPVSHYRWRQPIPIRSSPNLLAIQVDATPTAVRVMLVVDSGQPIAQHLFDLGDVPTDGA